MKTAIIGAGWAGLAAAVTLKEAGATVTVFEAGRTPGGRARRVPHSDFGSPLDNGQHLLLGAYEQTLALMRRLGRDPDTLFLRQRLSIHSLDTRLKLAAPPLPAPWHAALALLGARGLSWADRYAAIKLMRALPAQSWKAPAGWSVAQLLSHHEQTQSLCQQLWDPLCLAALNTPPDRACATLFANVLRDSLGGTRQASDFLLPRTDLSALWPDVAARQCTVRYGNTVRRLVPSEHHILVNNEHFDTAVLAVAPNVAARLLGAALIEHQASALLDALQAFQFLPIATLNLRLAAPWRLPQPMMLLREDPKRGHDGQWVFDRTQLLAGHHNGELAIVVSAAQRLADRDRGEAIAALIAQLREQAIAMPPMPEVKAAELFVEKRAAFAAVPGLKRPANTTPWPGLVLAGDWTDTGYPGVLEGAVRSGQQAARSLFWKL